VGDFEFQKKCLGKMEDVSKKEGRTVLFVSHNMGAVKNLTTRSILLNEGSLMLDESTTEVVNQYLRIQKSYGEKFSFKSEIFEGIVIKYHKGANAFGIFEDLKFEFIIKDRNSLPSEFRLGVTVSSMDEVNIFSGVSNVLSEGQYKEGKLALVIKSPNLVEGDYKLSFSIGLGDLFESRREFFVYRNALMFSVANLDAENPSLMNWQSSYGNIVFQSQNIVLS
jgi:lipopolysaccharide transport system ATP-binding protein